MNDGRRVSYMAALVINVCRIVAAFRVPLLEPTRDLCYSHEETPLKGRYEHCWNQGSEGSSRPVCKSRGKRRDDHCYGEGHSRGDARSTFARSHGDRGVEAYGPNPTAGNQTARAPCQSQA